MWSSKDIALFTLIQLANIPLMIVGLVLCVGAYDNIPWLWQNQDDPPQKEWSWWKTYSWLALRNPVANLRHVKGVSGKGRPLWYWSNGKYYAKLGWMSDGYPCMSAGAGKGY